MGEFLHRFTSLLDGQARAAFDTAALNHCAAGFRRDPGTEPVRTSAVTGVWLMGSFWHISFILPLLAVFYK